MGLVETVGLPPKKSIYVENLLLIQYFYDWFMCPKYMWLDMPNAFCCRLSLFCVFAKIKKTVSTSPGLPYIYTTHKQKTSLTVVALPYQELKMGITI